MNDDWRKRLVLAMALLGAAAAPITRARAVEVLPSPSGLATLVPLAWLSQPTAQGVAMVLVLALLALFVRGRATSAAGLGVFFVVLALNSVARSMTSEDPTGTQGSQVPCATLAAWLLGRALAPRLGRDREALGTSLACGVVAAAYTMAAISKLLARGIDWVDGPTLALMIYERASGALAPLAMLRRGVASVPWLSSLGMAGVLALESCGWLFLFRKARRAYAAAVVGFHVSSALLLGYPHAEWALTAIAWAWAGTARPVAASEGARRAPSQPA